MGEHYENLTDDGRLVSDLLEQILDELREQRADKPSAGGLVSSDESAPTMSIGEVLDFITQTVAQYGITVNVSYDGRTGYYAAMVSCEEKREERELRKENARLQTEINALRVRCDTLVGENMVLASQLNARSEDCDRLLKEAEELRLEAARNAPRMDHLRFNVTELQSQNEKLVRDLVAAHADINYLYQQRASNDNPANPHP